MYVRDHARPVFHKALGLNPTEYDYTVFRITQDIARQVFPVELDIDDPRFRAGLERLRLLGLKMQAAKRQGFLFSRMRRLALLAQVAVTFVRLFLLPTKHNAMPADVRMAPAW
jgi:magnesium-protoporphyrin IX monomethyl ester (oxidative) cyclase